MPLIKSKSKKAFSSNVKELEQTGHPQKQSLAIAYSVKKQSKAKGGLVLPDEDFLAPEGEDTMEPEDNTFLSDEGDDTLEPQESTENMFDATKSKLEQSIRKRLYGK